MWWNFTYLPTINRIYTSITITKNCTGNVDSVSRNFKFSKLFRSRFARPKAPVRLKKSIDIHPKLLGYQIQHWWCFPWMSWRGCLWRNLLWLFGCLDLLWLYMQRLCVWWLLLKLHTFVGDINFGWNRFSHGDFGFP
jgi:hypothetical protein